MSIKGKIVVASVALAMVAPLGIAGVTSTASAATVKTAKNTTKKLPKSWKGNWYSYDKKYKQTNKFNYTEYNTIANTSSQLYKVKGHKNAYNYNTGGTLIYLHKTTVKYHGHSYKVIAESMGTDNGFEMHYYVKNKHVHLPNHDALFDSTKNTGPKYVNKIIKKGEHNMQYYVLQIGNKHHKA